MSDSTDRMEADVSAIVREIALIDEELRVMTAFGRRYDFSPSIAHPCRIVTGQDCVEVER